MAKRPNVLWLMSDQHNTQSTGYSGNPNVRTPNLDRLAASGVNFRRAYTVNPICAPSRLSFITGQYCHTHGLFGNMNNLYDRRNPDTLACVFRRAGYQTAIFGKAHMVPLWDREGFEHIRYDNLGDVAPGDPMSCHYFRQIVQSGAAELMDREMTTPGEPASRPSFLSYEQSCEYFTGQEAINFLGSRDRSRPFFAQVSFQRPHGCDYAAEEFFRMYDPKDIVLPDSAADLFVNGFASKPAAIRDAVLRGSGYPLAATQERLKRGLCGYYALITQIDNEIGRVIAALEASGELDNTIILYTADHGDYAGEHGLLFKGLSLYESLHRVPFLLRWPGGPAAATCDELIETIDWYPTVCGLCGVDVPPGREGVDVLPIAAGQRPGKDAAFCEFCVTGKVSAVRTRQHRLIVNADCGAHELYDVQADPGEMYNLFEDPAHAAVRADLMERLLLFTLNYRTESSYATDAVQGPALYDSPAMKMHFGQARWGQYVHQE
ncbi:MAG: sulfatase-like hydrolase/transferase [Planctomycetaceae bacterium]|nr:sulfatase-like hydrolase/transferase [Planctomycetaceae bacterium]